MGSLYSCSYEVINFLFKAGADLGKGGADEKLKIVQFTIDPMNRLAKVNNNELPSVEANGETSNSEDIVKPSGCEKCGRDVFRE